MKTKFSLVIICFFLSAYIVHAQNSPWVWARSSDYGLVVPLDNTADKNGNVYVTGYIYDSVTINNVILAGLAHSEDIFLAKYDASGNLIWAKQAGSPQDEQANRIIAGDSGDVYIMGGCYANSLFDTLTINTTGSFLAKYDQDGHAVWVRHIPYTNYVLNRDSAGNLYFFGRLSFGMNDLDTIQLYAATSNSFFVAKYNTDGHAVWAKKIDAYTPNGIAVNDDGHLFLSGYFSNYAIIETDTLIATGIVGCHVSYDANGNFNQAKITAEYSRISLPCGNNGFYVSVVDSLLRYDNNADVIWRKKVWSNIHQVGSIAVDAQKNFYMTGAIDYSPRQL